MFLELFAIFFTYTCRLVQVSLAGRYTDVLPGPRFGVNATFVATHWKKLLKRYSSGKAE